MATKNNIRIEIAADEITKKLQQINDNAEKALTATRNDMITRMPPKVASNIASVYGLSKSEIPNNKKRNGAVATLNIKGKSIKDLKFTYKGRTLTPAHFKMSPKQPTGKSYTLKATILKGHRVTIGKYKNKRKRNGAYSKRTGGILMPTGTKDIKKTSHIPFQRMSRNRKDVHVMRTVSIKSMITNDKVSKKIISDMNDLLEKRYTHNINRYKL